MKKAILAMLMAGVLCGCQKLADYYNYPNKKPVPDCRIISRTDTGSDQVFIQEYDYTPEGYPKSITYITRELSFPYEESYRFDINYDGQNRVVSFTSDWVYGPDQVFFAYEGDSRLPVRDTLRGTFPNVFVEDLSYDSQGRVTGVYRRIIEQWEEDTGEYPDLAYSFYYDIRGNRQQHPSNPGYNGLTRYTNQLDPFSLHPVWQVLTHNSSRNTGREYITNDQGLPVGLKEGGVSFEYECN